LFAGALIAAVSVVTLVLVRKWSWLAVGWFWYLGTLVPVIGLAQVGAQSMADRYTYVPLIGVFIMIAWSLPRPSASEHRGSIIATATVASLILIALSVRTFAQVQLWKDSATLFAHAVNVTEGNYMAQKLLAGALMQQGKLTEARAHLEQSLKLRPNYADGHHDLGTILVRQKDFAGAKEQFLLALKTKPNDPFIWNALGLARAHLGEMDQAISDYRYALTLNPNYAYALANLGAALLVRGNTDEAINVCEKALTFQPNNAETHATLGAALWNTGQVTESIAQNRKAIEINPNLRDARFNLALALSRDRHYVEAIEQFQYLLRMNPEDNESRSGLAAAEQERAGTNAHP
jgi:protein O-mannosyl-transferase